MPRKKPNKVRERTAIICVWDCREGQGQTRPARNCGVRCSLAGLVQEPPYGLTVWSGTAEIVSLHTNGSIRQGPDLPPRTGTVIRVVPVVTSGGTCVDSPFARVNSAARGQVRSVMVHQFLVMG